MPKPSLQIAYRLPKSEAVPYKDNLTLMGQAAYRKLATVDALFQQQNQL